MTKAQQIAFSQGYQSALWDIARAFLADGEDGMLQWILENANGEIKDCNGHLDTTFARLREYDMEKER